MNIPLLDIWPLIGGAGVMALAMWATDRKKTKVLPEKKPDVLPEKKQKSHQVEQTPFVVPEGMTPEEATREMIRKDAEQYPIEVRDHSKETKTKQQVAKRGITSAWAYPIVRRGPRGGRYYLMRGKNGKRYRRYF